MTNLLNVYEERVVAYVDILGWSAACQIESQQLVKVIQIIADYSKNFSSILKDKIKAGPGAVINQEHMGIEFGMFSDNFAVSMPAASGYRIFDILSWACHPLLCQSFLTRGGITVGKLHHTENVIFGPALIEAHELEQGAVYPRLVCSYKLMTYLQAFTAPASDTIIVDQLGRRIANPFAFGSPPTNKMEHVLARERWQIPAIKEQVGAQITAHSQDATETIAEKWRYMRDVLPLMLKRFEEND